MKMHVENSTRQQSHPTRLPEWFVQPIPIKESLDQMCGLLHELHLHTICQSARCPNIGKCWQEKTATFMILGNACTRNCHFCAVSFDAAPLGIDAREPDHVALAVKRLKLRYVVITSVTRDDLSDQGAQQFVRTIQAVRNLSPSTQIEVLIPDFQGKPYLLDQLLAAQPAVIGHNLEMIKRLYPSIRPQGDYERSLGLLGYLKKKAPDMIVKSGFMVGLGEDDHEVMYLMDDIAQTGCDILTIGQYLAPNKQPGTWPVMRYVHPEMFQHYQKQGVSKGFKEVVSGPLVRSSFLAEAAYKNYKDTKASEARDIN